MFKLGDRVKIKDRSDWPTPPGYRLANAEGVVVEWVAYEETLREFQDYICVCVDKAYGAGTDYIGNKMFFRVENLELIR